MNESLIKVFNDMAAFEDYNGRPFPAKAYRNAVKIFQGLDFEVDDPDQIKDIPGIGSAIYTKVGEFLKNGTFPRYEEFKASDAAKIKEMAEIKGIGMAKAKKLYANGITSLEDLKKAVEGLNAGDKIHGSQEDITYTNAMKIGIEYEAHTDKNRMPIDEHDGIVTPLLEAIKNVPGVVDASATGSARRYDGSEGYTVGDADIIVGINSQSAISEIQNLMDEMLDEVIMSGDTKISGIKNRKQVDVRIVKEEDYGAMLLHSTGPAAFNVACRKIAIKNGWKLNEYGLFDADGNCISKDEKEILEKLGVGWIDPKDRKNFSGLATEQTEDDEVDTGNEVEEPTEKIIIWDTKNNRGYSKHGIYSLFFELKDKHQLLDDHITFADWVRQITSEDGGFVWISKNSL